ncbi:hypothetical protein B0H11DRAFT_957058 [Mycena galericulata]|nr:hypothetical protein B0H11DRAFT_957058 [Mycena galericulata]
MSLLQPSQLLRLPTELLLTVLNYLHDPLFVPFLRCEDTELPTFYPVRHILALSLVSRSLRHLCLPLLFCNLKIMDTPELHRLKSKCMGDPGFSTLIRKLDLMDILFDVDASDMLIPLLHRLKSLRWLELEATAVDGGLLAAVNSHPTLTTVAVTNLHLDALRTLCTSTSSSLSKIMVNLAESNCCFTLQSPTLHSLINRNPRLVHLSLRDVKNIKSGPGTLLLPDLEKLDIEVYCRPTSLMSWLPAFVGRHTRLNTITFIGNRAGSNWEQISFPLRFIDVLEREGLAHTASLNSFALSRPRLASALEDWPVAELDITILKALGVSALRIAASSLAPQISFLNIRMSSHWGREHINPNDFVLLLSRFASLQRLDLNGMYRHLDFERHVPSALPPSDLLRKTSNCTIAHAALRWLMARVALSTLSLGVIHIEDTGDDREGRSSRYCWRLQVTYHVQWNRELEVVGEPLLVMAGQYTVR